MSFDNRVIPDVWYELLEAEEDGDCECVPLSEALAELVNSEATIWSLRNNGIMDVDAFMDIDLSGVELLDLSHNIIQGATKDAANIQTLCTQNPGLTIVIVDNAMCTMLSLALIACSPQVIWLGRDECSEATIACFVRSLRIGGRAAGTEEVEAVVQTIKKNHDRFYATYSL